MTSYKSDEDHLITFLSGLNQVNFNPNSNPHPHPPGVPHLSPLHHHHICRLREFEGNKGIPAAEVRYLSLLGRFQKSPQCGGGFGPSPLNMSFVYFSKIYVDIYPIYTPPKKWTLMDFFHQYVFLKVP